MPWSQVVPVVDMSVRALCVREYPGHSKGCPNFNKKAGCPPQAKPIGELIDLSQSVYAVWNRFDLAAHVERMRAKNPAWSWRQLVCCLYWQPRARYMLRSEIRAFVSSGHSGLTLVACPEASGVNLTATMKAIGVALEWPPKTTTYQIVLAGQPSPKAPPAQEEM